MRNDLAFNKTLDRRDLDTPEVIRVAREIAGTALWLWVKGIPFATNGVLRRRLRIRWNKMWEYARGEALGGFAPGMRILDFGGGATLPIFHLARRGCDVTSLDIDGPLTAHADMVARRFNWKLAASTLDITRDPPPADWARFDRVISYCVIEHLSPTAQETVLGRLADLLVPGGRMMLTFDYGPDAPVGGAIRGPSRLDDLVRASGLRPMGKPGFLDTGERFVLDRKYSDRKFTFGALFLEKI
ncbi:MAG: class I SAM-dependent methyltransferase [Planctomycetota bacterium]